MGNSGRPSLGLRYLQVGLREADIARLDELAGAGRRSDYIRRIVEAALSGGGVPEVSVAECDDISDRVAPRFDIRSEDAKALLAVVRRRDISEREAAGELGWVALRVTKAAKRLSESGLIGYPRGAGVMVAL